MAHTIKGQKKLLDRLKRLQGQLNSVQTSLEKEDECYKILQTLASARGALNGLMGEIVEEHLREHIVNAKTTKDAGKAGEETVEILKSFWK
jgi:DNA-binding FrmR family transcriptional regulator